MTLKEKRAIQMVDLRNQYHRLKPEIDEAVLQVMDSSIFIKGPVVRSFEENLADYLGVKHAIGCANGTDALQVAFMALGLEPGDEVIVPAFTYVATAEVIGLLNLKPVMVDVDSGTFNVTLDIVKKAVTRNTKAIVPVHLFGQAVDMAPLLDFAKAKGISIVEDNAQAIGACYTFPNGTEAMAGTMGDIGTTSFFPSKNLGCYGDGGALFTNNDELAQKIRMVANHGQKKKYYHSMIGCNSRLDAMQAAVLNVKLKYLNEFCASRQQVANTYDAAFASFSKIQIPVRQHNSTHVFHQYTLRVLNGKRDELKNYLSGRGIPCGIYYPVPLYEQEAFKKYVEKGFELPTTAQLCREVISLPIHTEMDESTQSFIINSVLAFFND